MANNLLLLDIGIVSLAKDKQDEIEAKREEKKKRLAAEEAMKALRTRISFLLSQLAALSNYALDWQSQMVILQAQVNSLHDTNIELRSKLVTIQRTFMNRHVAELQNRSSIGKFITPIMDIALIGF